MAAVTVWLIRYADDPVGIKDRLYTTLAGEWIKHMQQTFADVEAFSPGLQPSVMAPSQIWSWCVHAELLLWECEVEGE